MLRATKQLEAQRERPFAGLRPCPERSEWGDKGTHPVMLSAAKHLDAQRDRPFAAAQGDKKGPPSGILDLCLRLMHIGADKSALGAIDRPLRLVCLRLFHTHVKL